MEGKKYMGQWQETLFNEHRKQLFDLIVYAKEHVPFYGELYKDIELEWETFDYHFFSTRIPIVKKEDISNYPVGNLADRYVEDKKNVFIERTSGSTGTPFVCYKDNKTRIKLAANLSDFRRQYSERFNINSRYVYFYGIITLEGIRHSNEIFVHKNTLYVPVLNLDTEHLIKIWDAICEFKPLWLMGTCTSVYYLAKCVSENSLPGYQFGFIELNGELVNDAAYDYIKKVFGCNVCNHYGMRELWCIAYSCPNGHLHLSEKTVFAEDAYNEEVGNDVLICTSLCNKVAPLIRYEIGDMGTVNYEPDCEFNGTKYTVDVSSGRISCFFECAGKKINLFIFALIIKNIVDVDGRNKIIRYQVQKTGYASLNIAVELNVNETLLEEDVNRIKSEIVKFAEADLSVNIEIVPFVKAQENGKVPEYIDLT